MVSSKDIYAWVEAVLKKEKKHIEYQLLLIKTIRTLEKTVSELEEQMDMKDNKD